MKSIITCLDGSAITSAVTTAAVWASKKLNKPILFLHTLAKEQQHGADDYTGAIGLGARSALLEEMTKTWGAGRFNCRYARGYAAYYYRPLW